MVFGCISFIQVSKQVEDTLNGEKLDAILCVAGGWAGGNAASKGDDHFILCFKVGFLVKVVLPIK